MQISHHIQGDAERAHTGLSQRPQLRVSQQSREDFHHPVSPQGNGLPPQRLRLLALHIVVHTCQSGQGPWGQTEQHSVPVCLFTLCALRRQFYESRRYNFISDTGEVKEQEMQKGRECWQHKNHVRKKWYKHFRWWQIKRGLDFCLWGKTGLTVLHISRTEGHVQICRHQI